MSTFPVGAFLNERRPAEYANSRACALSGACVRSEKRASTSSLLRASSKRQASGGVTKPGGRGRAKSEKGGAKLKEKKGGTEMVHVCEKSNEHSGGGRGRWKNEEEEKERG